MGDRVGEALSAMCRMGLFSANVTTLSFGWGEARRNGLREIPELFKLPTILSVQPVRDAMTRNDERPNRGVNPLTWARGLFPIIISETAGLRDDKAGAIIAFPIILQRNCLVN